MHKKKYNSYIMYHLAQMDQTEQCFETHEATKLDSKAS